MSFNCAESQSKICKAHVSDAYSRLAKAMNECNAPDKAVLKSNIFKMIDRMKELLDGKTPKDEPPVVKESLTTENEQPTTEESSEVEKPPKQKAKKMIPDKGDESK